MNNKYTGTYVFLGIILIACVAHGSDESGWTPWQSHDFHGDVAAGQAQLKLETERKRLEAEQKQESAERKLMQLAENFERDRLLRHAHQLKQQALLHAQQQALLAKKQARLQAEEQIKKEKQAAEEKRREKQRAQSKEIFEKNRIKKSNEIAVKLEEEALLEKAIIENELHKEKTKKATEEADKKAIDQADRIIARQKVEESMRKLFVSAIDTVSPDLLEQNLTSYYNLINIELRMRNIPELDSKRIIEGYKAFYNVNMNLTNRNLSSGFNIDFNFWTSFFYDCLIMVQANRLEVLHDIRSDFLQKDMNAFLDDSAYKLITNFKQSIFAFPSIVNPVHAQLLKLCNDEELLLQILRSKEFSVQSSSLNCIIVKNLKMFQEMLQYIEDNKKV